MDNTVLISIESLRRASLRTLRQRFEDVFGEEPTSNHRQHLFRRIAWRLQAVAEGDLSERARQRARAIANDADLRAVAPRDFLACRGERIGAAPGDRDRGARDTRLPVPGVLLSREWRGRTILVEVLAQGFRYDNRHYSSLSAIAFEVTGTRWNGLTFFGLNRRSQEHRKERRHDEK